MTHGRLSDLMVPANVMINIAPKTKEELFGILVEILVKDGAVIDRAKFANALWTREKTFPTGIGHGVAIPHAHSDAVAKIGMAAASLKSKMDYGSLDGEPVSLVFMVASPNEPRRAYTEILATLAKVLSFEKTRQELISASSPMEFSEIIRKREMTI